MRYLPICVDTKGRRVVVFGGAGGAEAKLRTLVKSDAEIIVIAAEATDSIQGWQDAGRLSVINAAPAPSLIDGAVLVYAATEDDDLNARIAGWATARNIPVNVADAPDDCSFITPALVDRSPVSIAIGTEGTSPGLARAIKSDLETRLPADLGETAKVIADLRAELKVTEPNIARRQARWAKVLGSGRNDFSALDPETIKTRYEKSASLEGESAVSGHVHIVGAGPGNPDLLTIGALRAMHGADVIVYDRLVSEDVLSLCRREAEFVYVGKQAGGPSTRQDEINRIIVERAKAGNIVVRLKSGDPLVFGRAEEEFAALDAAGLGFTIHPGITAATAAAASLRHSLTVRGENVAATLATGHDEQGFAELDWTALAKPGARASIYMGIRAARFIQGRLLLHGAARNTPVTIVENASRPNEIIIGSTIDTLPEDLDRHGIKGPAVLMVGYAPREAVQAKKAAI